jgi:hypothetical protein
LSHPIFVTSAFAARQHNFDIPAGSSDLSVRRFIEQAGLAVQGTGTTFHNVLERLEREEYDPSKHAVERHGVLKEIVYTSIADAYR